MKKNTINKKLVTTILLTFFAVSLTSAAGTIEGRITDKDGNPLPFASIVISHQIQNGMLTPMKTQIGTVTDDHGYYALAGVPKGTFQLEIIYLGFESSIITVEVFDDQTITENVALSNKTVDLEEVVVTTQARGQMAAINEQLSSIAIKNVVAADRIQRNPDANAAEAIGRLPGISVTRSGGEANDIVIRGMPAQYNTVLLNGIEIPSNKGTSRNASLGGVSQFSLQGIEVFKAITPDMDANTVSGAVNMQLKTAPNGFHGSAMLQGGYNNQNRDWTNYKAHANISNRFFENKLGFDLNINDENLNRSTESMGANFAILTNDAPEGEMEPMFLNTVSLQAVEQKKRRSSASLVVDYRFSPRSRIEFSSFFSSSPTDRLTISKSHTPINGSVAYNLNQNRGGHSRLYTGAIRGDHVLGIFQIDYSLAYSQSNFYDEVRQFGAGNPDGYDQGIATREFRSLPLADIIDAANDEETQANLRDFGQGGPGNRTIDNLDEKQYDARLNLKVPFRLGDWFSGSIKFGGMYRHKNRVRDFDRLIYGGPPFHKLVSGIQTTPDGIEWALPWVELNDNNAVSMENMVGGRYDNFLDGRFNFGWYPDVNKMNEIFDWWQEITTYYKAQGRDYVSDQQPGWELIFGQERMMGWWDPRPSVANDNSVQENYFAGYAMGELNLGKKVSLIPGFRYENVNYDMYAWWIERRINEGLEIPGHDTTAIRQNNMILPMVHLKVKPLDWFNIQLSYTKTIFRPNYNWIVPFEYIDDALKPFQYEAGQPNLKVEKWDNLDLMLAFHNNKIGLLSVNGFYKRVHDKIWKRTWTRIVGDEPVPYFPASEEVVVSTWYNHDHPTYVRGFEVEWQTNFWYLPKPLNFFTLTANYSYINNQAVYPDSRVFVVQTGVTDRGRPIFEKRRSDSTFTGPMVNQPSHLANVSLGFGYKAFDVWLSFQYIGETLKNKASQPEFDRYKKEFYRFELQSRFELPVKGMEILFNVANINNIIESEYFRGDGRPASLQAYGWTMDLGLRYIF